MLVKELTPHFKDRRDAGRKLAEQLARVDFNHPVVLAVPHGGVPVAYEIARALHVPLELLIVRKIPLPQNSEAGFGAIADDGTVLLNHPMIRRLGLTTEQIARQTTMVRKQIEERTALYLGNRDLPSLKDRSAILVDDGLASGFTMLAAIESVQRRKAAQAIVAAPAASASAFYRIKQKADEVICLVVADTPSFAVAAFYEHWHDLSESEVLALLNQGQNRPLGL